MSNVLAAPQPAYSCQAMCDQFVLCCRCNNLTDESISGLEDEYFKRIANTSFAFKQRVLRVQICMIRCCYWDFPYLDRSRYSCLEKCCSTYQSSCIKKTSKTASFCASCCLCFSTCGVHTYCFEWDGYQLDQNRVTVLDETRLERLSLSRSEPFAQDHPLDARHSSVAEEEVDSLSQDNLFPVLPASAMSLGNLTPTELGEIRDEFRGQIVSTPRLAKGVLFSSSPSSQKMQR